MAATSSTTTTHLLFKSPLYHRHNHRNDHHLLVATPPKPISVTCTATVSADRVFNFAAGPAVLSEKVLLKAQSELLNWWESGMSVMEISYRGKEFTSIIEKAESDLRTLLSIPEDYAVLFLQGGATTQFAVVPMNLCGDAGDSVDCLVIGSWGDKAAKEAKKYANVNVIWSGKRASLLSAVVVSSMAACEEEGYGVKRVATGCCR